MGNRKEQRSGSGVFRHWPLALVAGSFLCFGLLVLDDFGLTWDELHTARGAEANLRFVLGEAPFAETVRPIERMPGFYFAFNTARGVFIALVGEVSGWDPIRSHHLFNLILSTACVMLTYALAWQVSRKVRLSALAAASLAMLPSFLGHSQNNPKDLPAVFCYLVCTCLLVAVAEHGRRRDALAAAAALGVSFTTRVICAFIVPLALLWMALRWRTQLRRHLGPLAAAVAGSVPVAFACWPWLWDMPVQRLEAVVRLVTVWKVPGAGLYLGSLVDLRQMPWHYLPVHILVAMPLVFIALGALAPVAARAWRQTDRKAADAAWLGLVWVGFLLAAEQLSSRRYDGLRHFLAILPGVAIMVGVGLELLVGRVERALAGAERQPVRRLAAIGLVVAWVASGAAAIATVHPYEVAFLNTVANAVGGPRTDEWLEIEYWADAYREGVAWLDEHAEPEAIVCVPIADHVAAAHSRAGRIRKDCKYEWFRDASESVYVMFITRKSWYGDTIYAVERDYEPVFQIRRQQATLLKIYENRGPRKRPPGSEPLEG